MSVLLDTLRPWLVRYALWNTLVIVLLALPFSIAFSYLLNQFYRRIVLPRRIAQLCSIALLLLLQGWGWPWLRTQVPLLLADTTTGLVVIILAYGLASALFALGVGAGSGEWGVGNDESRRASVSLSPCHPVTSSAIHQLGSLTRFALYFIILSATPPLLLTGGEPFNMTHTLASWSFIQLWVNDDWLRVAIFTSILSGFALAVGWITNKLLYGSDRGIQWRWIFWLLRIAAPWCIVGCTLIFRWFLIGRALAVIVR